jgi:DNA polymerase-3 subunit epsilon
MTKTPELPDLTNVPVCTWEPWPEGMETARQLREKRLKPGPVAGKIPYSKAADGSGFLLVYRTDEATPNPITPQRAAAIEKGKETRRRNRTCVDCGRYVSGNYEDDYLTSDKRCRRCNVRFWARGLSDQEFLVFNCQTTGLSDDAEILHISLIDQAGAVVLDTYVKPSVPIVEEEYEPAEPEEELCAEDYNSYRPDYYYASRGPQRTAYGINGISNAMVADAPKFAELVESLREILAGKLILAYNAEFAHGQLDGSCRAVGAAEIKAKWECVMEWFAEFYGDYHHRRHYFRLQSLWTAYDDLKVPRPETYDFMTRVQATLAIVRALAAPVEKIEETAETAAEGPEVAVSPE